MRKGCGSGWKGVNREERVWVWMKGSKSLGKGVDLDKRQQIVRKGCGSGWKGVNREERVWI